MRLYAVKVGLDIDATYNEVHWSEHVPGFNPLNDDDRYTISPDPERAGWCTDSGLNGYCIPRAVAEEIARLSEAVEAAKAMRNRAILDTTLINGVHRCKFCDATFYGDDERATQPHEVDCPVGRFDKATKETT